MLKKKLAKTVVQTIRENNSRVEGNWQELRACDSLSENWMHSAFPGKQVPIWVKFYVYEGLFSLFLCLFI